MEGGDLNKLLLDTEVTVASSARSFAERLQAKAALTSAGAAAKKKEGERPGPPEPTATLAPIPNRRRRREEQASAAAATAETESLQLVYSTLDYVLTEELGGRANSAAGDGGGAFAVPRAALCAERAALCPLALAKAFHVQRRRRAPCYVRREGVSGATRELRRSLRLCQAYRDLTGGGITGPHGPRMREYLHRFLLAAMVGETVRAEEAPAVGPSPSSQRQAEANLTLSLFEEADTATGAEGPEEMQRVDADQDDGGSGGGGFSLTDFLAGSNSDSDQG